MCWKRQLLMWALAALAASSLLAAAFLWQHKYIQSGGRVARGPVVALRRCSTPADARRSNCQFEGVISYYPRHGRSGCSLKDKVSRTVKSHRVGFTGRRYAPQNCCADLFPAGFRIRL